MTGFWLTRLIRKLLTASFFGGDGLLEKVAVARIDIGRNGYRAADPAAGRGGHEQAVQPGVARFDAGEVGHAGIGIANLGTMGDEIENDFRLLDKNRRS